MVDFPKHMSRSGIALIKRLCRDIPAERLGYQRGGTHDIKKHKLVIRYFFILKSSINEVLLFIL